jgi:hypothetical protein
MGSDSEMGSDLHFLHSPNDAWTGSPPLARPRLRPPILTVGPEKSLRQQGIAVSGQTSEIREEVLCSCGKPAGFLGRVVLG